MPDSIPPLRSRDEIQAAHDRFTAILLEEVPYDGFKAPIVAACDALCWVLQHDHNHTFQDNLDKIDAFLAESGFVLERIPDGLQYSRRPNEDREEPQHKKQTGERTDE
jgi:hypothetical protein